MKYTPLKQDQNGIVAIFSVLIIMGILTLLTVGFSIVTRQAQRRTFNDHLNSQAFYAAESGVNMAATELSSGGSVQKSDCDGGPYDYDIDTANSIGISCLLINGNPSNLEFSNVPVIGAGESITSRLRTQSGTAISSIRVEWDSEQDTDPIANRPLSGGNPQFLDASTWGNGVGVLRIDLVPATSSPSNRLDAARDTYTFYVYPSTSGITSNTVSQGVQNQGEVFVTQCNSASGYRCEIELGLATSSLSDYYIRLSAHYNPVRARITGLDSSDNDMSLQDGQAVVDVTGRANDVYRRIQVRLPLTSSTGLHEVFSLFSGEAICKRYIGIPGATQDDPACSIN